MARIYDHAFFDSAIVPAGDAKVSIMSSAVLYGLSVYSVFPVCRTVAGLAAFRIKDHFKRLTDSARIIGIDTFEQEWTEEKFIDAARRLVGANGVREDVFLRATVHVNELLPGTRSRGLATSVSMFIYDAAPILPEAGARLKTSVWRRVSDDAIPARAKVNGAYVNSVLGKQDALDSGCDDCIFLDAAGHVCELSAANIFIVRDDSLATPGASSDILEGITRRTILDTARDMDIPVVERAIDLTELYIADEAFATGTSAFVSPIIEIDKRRIGSGTAGSVTAALQKKYLEVIHGEDPRYAHLLTAF